MTSYTIAAAAIDHYADGLEQFERLLRTLTHRETLRVTRGEVESLIQSDGVELLRRLTQGYFDQRGAEERIRERVVGEDGIARTHRRAGCRRRLETHFGKVTVTRRGYGGRGLDSIFPLDAELNLPPDKYSHGLREMLVEEVIQGSFDDAIGHLARSRGGRMAKRQAEELAVDLDQDFDAFYDQPPAPSQEADPAEPILAVSADGKGIVIRPDALREGVRRALAQQAHKRQTRPNPGEKRHCKRMATAISVYEIEPYVRTPERIPDPEQRPEKTRPRPTNKRTWALVEADLKTVVEQGFEEAVRRDPDQRMRWVVLVDSDEDLLRQVHAAAKRYNVEITAVQDFIHDLEYRWKAAHALYPEAGEEHEAWIKDRAHALLEGRALDVAVGLRRAATRKQLSQGERKPVDKAADYIENNRERLRYDQALAQDLPIATGVIEGACRHLINDRMDITDTRWGLDRAEAILKLCSLKVSGDLEVHLAFHFKRERRRHHPGPPIPEAVRQAA